MTPIIPPQFQRPAPAPIPQFHWSRIGPEAEVTQEMIEAGVAATTAAHPCRVMEDVQIIYRAMAALAPVPLVSPAEDAMRREITALTAALKQRTDERDTANADLAELSAIRWGLVQQIDDLQKELVIERMLHALSAKEATALQGALAKAITPTPPPQAPDPIANAIRPRETDRRRMGQ